MIRFRHDHPVIRKRLPDAVCGMEPIRSHEADALRPGNISHDTRTLCVSFAGYDKDKGRDDMVYLAVNTYWEDVTITLPDTRRAGFWYLYVNTYGDGQGRSLFRAGGSPD